ncbi:methionyl-tRNA formyltransferase [Alcanivorax quisquiliarum]|uniref:Methionyl-tRNA formyltransferase n=1 Tax=Alcanivorax quisquiliarum TaxID=2933565 RepID=A0ABT0E5H5_9GAMM|nr:methionyl-tRNA formyltransferase [Alcanivorax quisquiliarum]MCK0536939.1 methionyl-tRNA formyltransferase [Alcanivorax quisquiliarum]
MSSLRIVFAGTPDFAAISLRALLASRHTLAGVLTQPDRPAGRGKKPQQSDVKILASEHQLTVLQPENLRGEDIAQQLRDWAPDVMVVVAYGLLIPQAILDIPRYGCINVHGSLLPRWRGAAPVHRAIAAGDSESGVTIMQMEAGLDTGPMLLKRATPIHADDTGGSLYQRIADLGAAALVDVLDDLPRYLAGAEAQPDEGVTYAHKLTKDEAQLDWSLPAQALHDRIRAFNPWPVTWTSFGGQALRIWASEPGTGQGAPGTVLSVDAARSIEVACGEGSLHILHAQLPGKKPLPTRDLLSGRADQLAPGQLLSAGFGGAAK